MAHHDHALAQPFGPGGADVVLPQHLEHHGSCHAHRHGRQRGAQHQRRDDHLFHVLPGVIAELDIVDLGRPAPPNRWEHHHHRAHPKAWHGQQQDREGTRCQVARRVLAHRRINADRQCDHQADRQRHRAEFEGHRQAVQHFMQHRRRMPERVAQVALQDGSEPAEVLLGHRPVQAQGLHQLFAAALVGADVVLAQHQVDHVTRNHPDRHEDNEAGNQQCRDQRQQAAQHISAHQSASLW